MPYGATIDGQPLTPAGIDASIAHLKSSHGDQALSLLNTYGAKGFADIWNSGRFVTNDPTFISQLLADYQQNEAIAATPWYEDPIVLAQVGTVALAGAGAAGYFSSAAAASAPEGGAIAATGAETAGYSVVSGYTPSAAAATGGAFDVGGSAGVLSAGAAPTLFERATDYAISKAQSYATSKLTGYVSSLLGGKPSTQSAPRPGFLPQQNATGFSGLSGMIYGGGYAPNSAGFYSETAGASIGGPDSGAGSAGLLGSINPVWILVGFITLALFGAVLIRR